MGLNKISSTTQFSEREWAAQINSAMSSGFINLLSGNPDNDQESVNVAPGNMEVTLTLNGFNSSLKTLLKPNNPNFDMQ